MRQLAELHELTAEPAARQAGALQRALHNAFPFVVVGVLWDAAAHLIPDWSKALRPNFMEKA